MAETLPLHDTRRAYGTISRALHWLIALLLLLQFTGMGAKIILGRGSPTAGFLVGLHQPVGTILFVLIAIRIVWAIANRNNRPDHGHDFRGRAAIAGHLSLYALMAFVPTVALLRAWGSERAFAPFGFEIFSPKAPPFGWTSTIAEYHGEAAWLLGVLILGHIVMVGVHETMWRDGTLARMAGRITRRPAASQD